MNDSNDTRKLVAVSGGDDSGPGRLRRVGRTASVIGALLAVYAPVALVMILASDRTLIARAYLVLAIWAVEGIAWYCQGGIALRRTGAERVPRGV